jgi:hypothetical protein
MGYFLCNPYMYEKSYTKQSLLRARICGQAIFITLSICVFGHVFVFVFVCVFVCNTRIHTHTNTLE